MFTMVMFLTILIGCSFVKDSNTKAVDCFKKTDLDFLINNIDFYSNKIEIGKISELLASGESVFPRHVFRALDSKNTDLISILNLDHVVKKNIEYEDLLSLVYKYPSASEIQKNSIITSIIENNCINVVDGESKKNVFMEMIRQGFFIEELLGLGIDINAVDNSGKTALDYALENSIDLTNYENSVISKLLSHGSCISNHHLKLAAGIGRKLKNKLLSVIDNRRKNTKKSVIDIALCTKGRISFFKNVLFSLNNSLNAENISVFILDGNEDKSIEKFIDSNGEKWRFCSLRVWKDSDIKEVRDNPGSWPIMYNFLFKQGTSPYLSYWSDDVFMVSSDGFSKSVSLLKQSSGEAAIAVFPFYEDGNRVLYVNFGVYMANYCVIDRKVFEKIDMIDEGYRFYTADGDLSCKIFYDTGGKTILCENEKVFHWKDNYSIRSASDFSKKDNVKYENRWGRYGSRTQSLNKESVYK